MITAKRRITTEQDRFGGYAIQPSQKLTFDENLENAPLTDSDRRFDFRVNTDEPSFSATPTYSDMSNYSGGRTYAAPYSEQNAVNREQPRAAVTQQPSVIEYSTRQDYAGTTGFMQNPVATPSYTKSRRKKEDLMPSIRTRAYGQPELREAEKEEEKSRPRDEAFG